MSAALLGAMVLSANAQEEAASTSSASSSSSDYKPAAGEKSLEVQFAPLGGNPISIGGIRLRSFSSSTSAMRLNVFIGYNTSSDITQQEDSDNDILETKDVSSSFTIALAPGIESHFPGTDRISPYVGAELPLSYTSSSEKVEQQVADEVQYTKTIDGSFSVGLNGLAGVDFYFTPKMYLGTELGFGLQYTKTLPTKTKLSEGDAPDPVKNGSSFTVAPNVQGQIRLGFLF